MLALISSTSACQRHARQNSPARTLLLFRMLVTCRPISSTSWPLLTTVQLRSSPARKMIRHKLSSSCGKASTRATERPLSYCQDLWIKIF